MSLKLSSYKYRIYHDLRDLLIKNINDSTIQKLFKKYSNRKDGKNFILLNDIEKTKDLQNNTLLYFKLSIITKGVTAYTYEYIDLKFNESLLIKFSDDTGKNTQLYATYILSDLKVRNRNISSLYQKMDLNKKNYYFHFQDLEIDIYEINTEWLKKLLIFILFIAFILIIIIVGCI